MASLLKRDNSPFWFAAFDVPQPDGSYRRIKKSTKQRKRADAMAEAVRMEEAACKAAMATDGDTARVFAILEEAAAAAARGELSEARGRELLARMCKESTGEALQFYTVKSWAEDWLTMKRATGKPATIARYSKHVHTFLAWLGDKADGRLESVTKSEVRAFRDAIRLGWMERKDGKKKEGIERTAKTTNHYCSDVAGMFRAAVREGLLLASPCAALEKLPEYDSTEREVFTVAEVGKLVSVAGETSWQAEVFRSASESEDELMQRSADWQGLILMGFYVGARLGDCAAMRWENVNLERKTITFMPAKTSRKRKKLEVPLHPRLFSFLEPRAVITTKPEPLFPMLVNAPVGGRHGLSSQFIAIMDAGGIDRQTTRKGIKGGQRAQHARSFHALRHSLTSTLANADVSEEIRRRIVGHESADVHAGYTHTERETLARALEKIPSI